VSTYILLFNHFSFAILFHNSCLLSVFEQRICTCVIQICFTPGFVLFLGLGQEAQQVVCRGLLAWGSKNIYEIFSRHLVCISLFHLIFLLFFFFFLPLVFWVFWHLIYMWHGLSHSMLIFVSFFFFLILCTCFWVWCKKHGLLVFWELFLLFFGFFFLLSSIVYMHLSLGQEAWPPCLLGDFSFICWLFFLLFSYIVYMLTKTSVICVLK